MNRQTTQPEGEAGGGVQQMISGVVRTTAWAALLALGLASAPLATTPVAAAPLQGAEMSAAGDAVELRIGGQPSGKWFALDGPRRLVVDLRGTSATARSVSGVGPVLNIRTAQFDPDTARVVFDLSGPATVSGFRRSGDRLVVDLAVVSAGEFARLVGQGRQTITVQGPGSQVAAASRSTPASARVGTPAPKPAATTPPPGAAASTAAVAPPKPKAPERTQVASVTPSPDPRRHAPQPRARSGLPVVVIDPGHGGRDPGSIGPGGEQEKDAVLGIAKAIKAKLESTGRYRAILTRENDIYIPHRQRTDVARKVDADLFISIHADSFPKDPTVSGATIYTLSETASDKEAARLASRENRSDLIAGVDLAREDDDVTSILIDLAQRETMNASAEFAAILQHEMVGAGVPFKGHFHRFAGFLVLKAPDVPAVLLETGYMSNPKDAAYLFSRKGQDEIAKGVASAVESHIVRRLARR